MAELYEAKVIAQLFEVSVRRVQQLTQDGVISTVSDGGKRRYDLVPTIQNYIRFLSAKAHGKAASDTEKNLKAKKLQADIDLKESQGELHRLKTEIATGKYVSVAKVEEDYRNFFAVFKNFALALPSRLSGLAAGDVSPETARRLEGDVRDEVIRQLSQFVVSAGGGDASGKKDFGEE